MPLPLAGGFHGPCALGPGATAIGGAVREGIRDDIVVVFVDINRPETKGIDWKSPVAVQHGMRSIPHFKIFGPDGKLIAEDTPKDAKARQMVTKWFE